MSENKESQTAATDLMMLAGGLITNGAIGWFLYRMFKSQQIDYQQLMTAASLVGGIGIYDLAVIFKFRKPSGSQRKPITSEKNAANITVPVSGTSDLAILFDRLNEWDKIFTDKDNTGRIFDKKISRNNKQEVYEATSKYKDLRRRLNDLNPQERRNIPLDLSADNQMKTCYIEWIRSLKEKFREEIISNINELKGYVQGMIDPLPLAKSFHFQFTEMSDENRRQIVMIVNEFADRMLLKLDKITDEFVYSLCEAGEVLNDKEHKGKNALEILGVPEKYSSAVPLKIEMNEYYKALEKATKSKSQIPSGQNGPRSTNVSGASAKPLESVSTHSLQEIIWKKTSELESSMMPTLETPDGGRIPFKPREVNKPDHRVDEKLKSPQSQQPPKLVLNEEQKKYLNILKSELEA